MKFAIRNSGLRAVTIAKNAGITPSYLSILAAGKRSNPSYDILARIAAATGVDPIWLAHGREPAAHPPEPGEGPAGHECHEAPATYSAQAALLDVVSQHPATLAHQVEREAEALAAGDITAIHRIRILCQLLRKILSEKGP